MIEEAYRYAERKFGDKLIGEYPLLNHLLGSSAILVKLHMDPESIAAALLHHAAYESDYNGEEIGEVFGTEIVKLIEGAANLKKIGEFVKHGVGEHSERNLESLRKMMLSMLDDLRIMIVKLATRLNTLRNFKALPEEKRAEVAWESLNIFAPLANRLGIWNIKWELEDLSFRYLKPDEYARITSEIDQRRVERERYVDQIRTRLTQMLDEQEIMGDVHGRSKHVYSIWKKMQQKGLKFDEIYDAYALRVIVSTIEETYLLLSAVHRKWTPVPGSFDDYISEPKKNMYQSIHTALRDSDGKAFEIQIRTKAMHRVAEYGVAAHWRYKEKRKTDTAFDTKIAYLRQLLDWQMEQAKLGGTFGNLHSGMYDDRVYVFTPQGEIKELPAGSTPVDFAYSIHSEIGHRCRGAQINSRMVPLTTKLKTGDEVKIRTVNKGGPSLGWLDPESEYVRTRNARTKIRSWFRKQNCEESIAKGRDLIERELKKIKHTISNNELSKLLNFNSVEDMWAAVGYGDIGLTRVQGAVNRHLQEQEKREIGFEDEIEEKEKAPRPEAGIYVQGVDGLMTHIAECCRPVPGDAVLGYITRGRGITVHRKDCPNISKDEDQERHIKVFWDSHSHKSYPAAVKLKFLNKSELTHELTGLINERGLSIRKTRIKAGKNGDYSSAVLIINVHDRQELEQVMERLKKQPQIHEITRL